jgi:hypothetical protein
MKLLTTLERTRDETLGYFSLGDEELSRSYAAGKWSIRYLLHHLADSELVLYDRIARIISEPRQVLWVYDQEAWSKGLDYSKRPLEISRAQYAAIRESIRYYAALHYEKDGHLEFVHSVTGVRTLKDELEKVANHNEHHLDHIRIALRRG